LPKPVACRQCPLSNRTFASRRRRRPGNKKAIRLPNGNLLIPVQPDESDAKDCMAEITSDDPEYDIWLAHAVDGEDPRRKAEE